MIIDTHAYCFAPLDSARGYDSAAAHLALVASGNAGHHQPALRLDDGKIGDSAALTRADCGFRLDKQRGRIEWTDTTDGSRYSKYFIPPALIGMEYTPHALDAEMHYAGVDAALLHTNDMLVRDPSYYRDVVRAFPGRLFAMTPSREGLITTDTAAAIRDVEYGIRDCGLHAIKFHVNSWYNHTAEPWDDNDAIRPYWEAVTALDVPIFFTPGHGPLSGQGNAAGFSVITPSCTPPSACLLLDDLRHPA